jgi:hypothetical protein
MLLLHIIGNLTLPRHTNSVPFFNTLIKYDIPHTHSVINTTTSQIIYISTYTRSDTFLATSRICMLHIICHPQDVIYIHNLLHISACSQIYFCKHILFNLISKIYSLDYLHVSVTYSFQLCRYKFISKFTHYIATMSLYRKFCKEILSHFMFFMYICLVSTGTCSQLQSACTVSFPGKIYVYICIVIHIPPLNGYILHTHSESLSLPLYGYIAV